MVTLNFHGSAYQSPNVCSPIMGRKIWLKWTLCKFSDSTLSECFQPDSSARSLGGLDNLYQQCNGYKFENVSYRRLSGW